MKNLNEHEKEILEKWNKYFDHDSHCKNFPESEPKNCRCQYDEQKQFLSSALHSQRKVIGDEVIKLLQEFANTPLDKRKNGWEWLLKIQTFLETNHKE